MAHYPSIFKLHTSSRTRLSEINYVEIGFGIEAGAVEIIAFPLRVAENKKSSLFSEESTKAFSPPSSPPPSA